MINTIWSLLTLLFTPGRVEGGRHDTDHGG